MVIACNSSFICEKLSCELLHNNRIRRNFKAKHAWCFKESITKGERGYQLGYIRTGTRKMLGEKKAHPRILS